MTNKTGPAAQGEEEVYWFEWDLRSKQLDVTKPMKFYSTEQDDEDPPKFVTVHAKLSLKLPFLGRVVASRGPFIHVHGSNDEG